MSQELMDDVAESSESGTSGNSYLGLVLGMMSCKQTQLNSAPFRCKMRRLNKW